MARWLLLALALVARAGLVATEELPLRCLPADQRCASIGSVHNVNAMPSYETQLRVIKAQLNCPTPSGSYGAVLQRLNVSVSDTLKLVSAGKLSAAHLADLPDARTLQLVEAELAPRSLAALSLHRLLLPNLVNVAARDSSNVSVAVGGTVQVLALEMPAARVPSALSQTLRHLTVLGWAERSPAPWSACALHTLNLNYVMAEELPARWVSAFANMSMLHVQDGSHLRALQATSLRGARLQRELNLSSCALEALPVGFLDDAVVLSVLDLSKNFLKELPSGLFVRTRSLHTLSLSRNLLTTDVYSSLKAVTSLSSLDLSYNELRDSCDTVSGVSPLKSLNKLTYLDLKKTNASLVCHDWRVNIPLFTTLDLSWNHFNIVKYADPKRVRFRRLHGKIHDYQLATGTARALKKRPAHMNLTAKCAREPKPLDLQSVVLETLMCAAPKQCVGARGCACTWRDSGVEAPPRVLRVYCERAGLTRLADVLAPLRAAAWREHATLDDYDVQLYLAHNRISDLNAADIPKHLSVLDLRNNSLSLLSEEAMRALLTDERRRLVLAQNKLACNCSAYDAVNVMRAHQAGLDYDALTCADGSRLARARLAQCATSRSQGASLVAAPAALVTLVAAAALACLLLHLALRLRLKAALHARGWLPALTEPDDDERRFDVFLSFSHGDERFVRDELVARLESGPAPYRLCVHYRDWVPGGWIPAQIAASVRASRRTVAVVSAHFLRSAWAHAEFQEAYALALRDARPRLVIVLLDDPAALPLDDKLRSYLATNTYVRWGDPWFWQKLRLALPRGRGPAPVELPPAPAEPSVTWEVCSELSALNSPQSSSCSSVLSSSAADSAEELRWLVVPASCGAQMAGDVPAFASTHTVPV